MRINFNSVKRIQPAALCGRLSLVDVNMKLKLLSEERDGPILRCLYACPCGQGTVEEEQDYTEGHRDCWASLKCSICRNNYKVIFSDSGLSWDIVKNDSVQIENTKEIIQNRSAYMPYSYVINSNHTVSKTSAREVCS